MAENLNIAFNLKDSKEYFIKYTKKEYLEKNKIPKKLRNKKFYIFEKEKPKAEEIGTFLISFLNTDFTNKEEFNNFIFEYLFVTLITTINKDIYFNSEIHGDKILPCDLTNIHFEIILSEDEINYYIEKIYKKYSPLILECQKEYIAVANLKYFEYLYSDLDKTDKLYNEKIKACEKQSKNETYISSLNNISSNIQNLKTNFYLRPFYTEKNKKEFIESVPYSFTSNKFYDILFISFKELAHSRKSFRVQICDNCNKYFIPKTAHETKYCDELFDGIRTCKQIGAELTHKRTLKEDPLCQKYRNRYQSLCKQASNTQSSKSIQLYEKYKTEGADMLNKYKHNKISAKEFESWINSMKIRKYNT